MLRGGNSGEAQGDICVGGSLQFYRRRLGLGNIVQVIVVTPWSQNDSHGEHFLVYITVGSLCCAHIVKPT